VSDPDLLVDTSVAVALVLEGHEAHDVTFTALNDHVLGLAGHAWFETYSVLTRLPSPVRRAPIEITEIIRRNFPESRFLPEEAAKELASRLAGLGIAGGAIYDALVAQVAVTHGLTLATRDQRAIDVYRALEARVRLIA
jgi:predicted nucleic acid-binding protein